MAADKPCPQLQPSLLMTYIYPIFSVILPNLSGCNGTEPSNDCCTSSNLCGEGEGDCDNDSHCFGALKCGSNNCISTFSPNSECCYDPNKQNWL